MITIERAPAYTTLQDSGRRGFLASGVPRSGAMDLPALSTLNALLGNDARAAGVEWALTGGQLRFDRGVTFAVGGAIAIATLGGRNVEPFRAYHAAEGVILSVEQLIEGRFLYVAFAGGIECEQVMRSRSTYLPGGFGGIEGRRLKSGDKLHVARSSKHRHQVSDPLPQELRPPFAASTVRYVPREDGSNSEAGVMSGRLKVSAASDRTGYRLEGATRANGASITSEPVCPGTVQLPPGGEPIVLMADAPTIGGYRIMGAVISADLGALAQRLPGEEIELVAVTVEQAQRELESRAEIEARVRDWSLA